MVLNIDEQVKQKLLEQDVKVDIARSCIPTKKPRPEIKPTNTDLVKRKPANLHHDSVMTMKDSIRDSNYITMVDTPSNKIVVPKISDQGI